MCTGSGRHPGPAHILSLIGGSISEKPQGMHIMDFDHYLLNISFCPPCVCTDSMTFLKAQAPSSLPTRDKNVTHFCLWNCFLSSQTMSTSSDFPRIPQEFTGHSVYYVVFSRDPLYAMLLFIIFVTYYPFFLDDAILIVNEGLCILFLKWMWSIKQEHFFSNEQFSYICSPRNAYAFFVHCSLLLFGCRIRVILRMTILNIVLCFLFHELFSLSWVIFCKSGMYFL